MLPRLLNHSNPLPIHTPPRPPPLSLHRSFRPLPPPCPHPRTEGTGRVENKNITKSNSKPKGALITALVFFLLGLGGCGYGAARGIPFITDLVDYVSELDNFATTVPMGESASFTSSGTEGLILLTGEAVCTGSGPGGDVRFDAYESFGPGTTVEINNANIDGYILFDTETGDDYEITCGSRGSGQFIATTAPTFLVDGAPALVGAVFSGLAGVFLVFLSFIFLIVGLVQRSSWKKKNRGSPAAPYGSAPPAPAAPYGAAPGVPGQAPPLPAQAPPAQAPPAQAPPVPGQGGDQTWGGPPPSSPPAQPPPFGGNSTPPAPPPPPQQG